ncbi:nucleoside diphosphate-linked moiety X motif 17-like [Diadema antillarum]|uniref:nucleoside diphosphate-linked moiety X motif 17-like n=1 Tax=Diadema antillarum TaxID=105358 RepID=UPI003A8C7DD1
MAKSSIPQKVLVHLRRKSQGFYERAVFKQCILDYLGFTGTRGEVTCRLEGDQLMLSPVDPQTDEDCILLKHPSFCPLRHLSPDDVPSIPEEILERGVDCGVATLLWSADHYLLLTRRASHLRTFPNVWVPPGGHIELGETLIEAGLRELKEETGLQVNPKECRLDLVALWESVYPPMLSRGLPKRHHIVVYQSVTSSKDHHQLDQELCIDPNEVGAAAWLEESMVRALTGIADSMEDETDNTEQRRNFPDFIRATVVDPSSGQTTCQNVSTVIFSERAPPSGNDVERISTGTLFAMEQWCSKNTKR